MGHEWDHVAATAFLPARETFFAQNGTWKKGTNTKMSRGAKRPEDAPTKKDSFYHGGGTSLRQRSAEVEEVGCGVPN